jgi:ABC-type phosphate transport system substrate-binding protein
MNAQSADISLVYDEPISPDLPAYLIGEDRLVVIVHPQNGLSTINLESLQGILQGFIPSWSMVDAGINAAAAPPISIVVYNQQDDFQQLIEDRMNGGGTIIQYSSLAEHPGKVVEIVAKEMGSLGIIPAAYLNDTVKELHLTGIDKNNLSIQIIVQTRSQPTQTQHTFITCLQESLSN